jgi:predicted metal-dependent phosphoesterase TrpH
MRPEDVVDKAAEAGLHEIVIKDHDQIEGALRAKNFAVQHYRDLIKVNLGIEMTTEFGEIGAGFLTEEQCLRLIESRNERGKFDFGKIVEISREFFSDPNSTALFDLHHPFDFANPKRGFNFEGPVDKGIFYDTEGLLNFFDYTEINTASTSVRETWAAFELADESDLPLVCSTDSHFLSQIGRYYTETDKTNARDAIIDNVDLKHSIKSLEEIKYFRSRIYRVASWMLKRKKKLVG